jgi:TonB family protein
MKSICLVLVSLAISGGSVHALTPNIPAGTLTPDFGIMTRLGTFEHAVGYGPIPRVPPTMQHWSGQGVVILDLSVRTGLVDIARIWQSTGATEIDDALVATLQQWRVKPRTVYKLYVPVKVSRGKVHLGSTQPLL